jgi:uncharacterized protein YegL
MSSPNGSTALYDAIQLAISQLTSDAQQRNTSNWVVALTDGEDNASKCKLPALQDYIRQHPTVGVIIVGVGADVQHVILNSIVDVAKKGKYIFAKADQDSIKEAFGEVAAMIQTQVVLEDY